VIVLAAFVDDVMRELVAALGGALFLGNLLALIRRRFPPEPDETNATDLPRAPTARTVIYLLIGFVVMVWGIASLVVS